MAKKYEIDMTHGPMLGKVLLFAIPLMASSMLQLLFNAADIIVVGRFVGNTALAAVGSTSSLINLLINLFMGLSVGVNVCVATYYGGGKHEDLSRTVHTAILTSIISGICLVFLGVVLAKPLLSLMGTPEDVISQSVLYMRIYFLGMPVLMLYNFGAAILRAVGDTKRPLYFLMGAGVINVVFNLILVLVVQLGVAGVAIATVSSECFSAVMVVRCLMKEESSLKLELHKLRIHKDKLKAIFKIGIPAGLQGCVFSVSNVLIQSSINSFGSIAMAGSTASSNIEGFVYNGMNALYQTNLSFTSQNVGARNYKRVDHALVTCEGVVIAIGVLLGFSAVFFGTSLLGIYSSDPEVIAYGLQRLTIIGFTYFFCGMMDTFVGSLRGMGYSVVPMIVSLTGACGFRILWIYTVFHQIHTLQCLYLSYPISWVLTAAAHFVTFLIVRKRVTRREYVD